MIKASVIFEDTELVYKYKKKEKSIDRYKLVNSHTCASIDNELLKDTVDYIYNSYDTLYEIALLNKKKDFIMMCNDFKDLEPNRSETINNKTNYILNNWNARQIYQNNSYMRCSMESHISHIFADLFTSTPKAYSKTGLRQLLKLRLLKTNRKDIKKCI